MNRSAITLVLCSVIVVLTITPLSRASSLQALLRKNIPEGFTMETFVEICEECGVLYGNDFSYKCLSDLTRKMFKGCVIAVTNKRKR